MKIKIANPNECTFGELPEGSLFSFRDGCCKKAREDHRILLKLRNELYRTHNKKFYEEVNTLSLPDLYPLSTEDYRLVKYEGVFVEVKEEEEKKEGEKE